MADSVEGPYLDIMSDEFAQQAAAAGDRARRLALSSGIAVTYLDERNGIDTMEFPDGRKVEIRWIPGAPRGKNYEVVRVLVHAPAA